MPVPVRAANADRRGQHRSQAPGYFSTDGIGQDRISAKRQVAAVMLDRSERHHCRRGAALDELLELARGRLSSSCTPSPMTEVSAAAAACLESEAA